MSQIVVIGAGAWGTALAQAAFVGGNRVTLIARAPAIVDEINLHHTNSKYLGSSRISEEIVATRDLKALAKAETVILAVPAQFSRAYLRSLPQDLKRAVPVVVTAKGFENKTLSLQTQIVEQEWGKAVPLVLCGPSFAHDVVAGKPTAVTLAGKNEKILFRVGEQLASEVFRPYFSTDPVGVEICGGLKNVYALASGAIEGAGLGLSARSAFVSRALIEMGRFVEILGGTGATTQGLAGVGDLVLSCTSTQSRNYRFGLELGRSESVAQITNEGQGLAEGVATAPVALALAQKNAIKAPLVEAVNQMLVGNVSIAQIVEMLMTRPLKSEKG